MVISSTSRAVRHHFPQAPAMTIVAQRLRGRKTYTAAALLAAYAVFGWTIGQHDGGQTVQLLFEAIMAATLRNGIK